MATTSANMNVTQSGVARKVHVFKQANERIFFEDGYIHYVHPEALIGVDGLTISGLKNAEIYFMNEASIAGEVYMWRNHRDNNGVLNILDCENIFISGSNIVNTKEYGPENIVLQSAVAINVARSKNVTFDRTKAKGEGKTVFAIHSGSEVALQRTVIESYYFGLNVSASKVSGVDTVLIQEHKAFPDSHSAIWVSSSMRHGDSNVLYEETELILDRTEFVMRTGRAIVSGNGSYHTNSDVKLTNNVFTDIDETFGVCVWHENYNSISVTTDLDVPDEYDDYVSTPTPGFARFVNYYATPGDEKRPGGPNGESPIVIDGISSDEVEIDDAF